MSENYESLMQGCKAALVIMDMLADALLNTYCTCSAGCNCGRQFALDAFKSYANGTFKIEDLP